MKRSLLGLTMIASFSCLAEGALDLTTLSNNNTDNLVWVGHLSPDTDSAVSVILASHIYGGEAALTGEA
ncbi:manganese-dependent inorganic pyrophosphatase, partial [Vibrio alginolyticus]|nr:manganese-dependent inorganic pyrophosphatase [Vibrio alginolyticus]MDW1934930.1 manganese-dependent inorganic pyrophosphatase [Vibrio sp. 970]